MIKAGVIGLGYWGPNILRNFHQHPNIEVAKAADRSERARKAMKAIYPAVSYVEDGLDVIQDPEIQAVAIATPVATHYPLVREALSAGKHVWVEKPITRDAAQAAELVALAEERGLILMVDHTFIYTPAVEKLKDVLVRGELGDMYYYDSVRVNLGLFQNALSVLWDLAPHDLAIMDYLIDRPIEWVQAVGARHAGQEHETLAYVAVQFADNILGHLHVNWLAPAKIRQVVMVGSKRMCVYDDTEPSEKVKIYDRGVELKSIQGLHDALVQYRLGDMHVPALPSSEALGRATTHFVHCIQTGTRPMTDGRSGLRVVEILDAAERSLSNEGQRIHLKATIDADAVGPRALETARS